VPACLPDAAPAGGRRRRAREGLLPVEHDGQLRVDQRVRRPVRAGARGLPDAEADAQGERRVVPRGGAAQRGGVGRRGAGKEKRRRSSTEFDSTIPTEDREIWLIP